MPEGKTPRLELRDLSCGYSKVRILRDVSLQVAPGEIGLMVGVNGSGKSTLLRVCMGLAELFNGTIHVDGQELPSRMTPAIAVRTGIQCLPQARSVFSDLSVRENLTIRSSIAGGSLQLDEAVALGIDLFPWIEKRLSARGRELSGGEQRMVGLASVLAVRPRVLLLDEPTLGLTPTAARAFFERLRSWTTEKAMAVLVAEQRLAEIADVADTVHIVSEGAVSRVFSGRTWSTTRDLTEQLARYWMGPHT